MDLDMALLEALEDAPADGQPLGNVNVWQGSEGSGEKKKKGGREITFTPKETAFKCQIATANKKHGRNDWVGTLSKLVEKDGPFGEGPLQRSMVGIRPEHLRAMCVPRKGACATREKRQPKTYFTDEQRKNMLHIAENFYNSKTGKRDLVGAVGALNAKGGPFGKGSPVEGITKGQLKAVWDARERERA